MPAYIPITEIETDPEAPLTSELAKKWRDNPLAVAKGATGAPRISPLAFDGSRILPGISGTGSVIDLGNVRILELLVEYNDGGGGLPSIQVQFSNNNGSTWGSYQTLFSGPGVFTRLGRINLETGAFLIGATTGTFTVPSNVNAVGFRPVGSGVTSFVTPIIGGGRL